MIFIVISPDLMAQEELQKKIDSIFVIASSGELKYREMVEPAIDALAEMGEEGGSLKKEQIRMVHGITSIIRKEE